MFDISLIGGKKLQKKLNKLEKKAQGKILKEALKGAMEPVKSLAKQRAPQDKGLLVKSIRIAVKANRNGAGAMVRTGTRKQLKIDANDKYYYPAAHEYGTKHMPAKSFLRSSLSDKKQQVLSESGRNIARLLESAK